MNYNSCSIFDFPTGDSNPDPLKYVISSKVIDLGFKLRITYKQSEVTVERLSILQL